MAEKFNVGVVGCGAISALYMRKIPFFRNLALAACADIVPKRAEDRAKELNVPKVYTVDELIAAPDVDIVLNLTIPKVHSSIALAALKEGKHVYNEKPLAQTRDEAKKMLKLAKKNGLRIGCAPDTFLGGGIQTCRKVIDDGWIGRPLAASAFMLGHGPENWHLDPDFFYQPGGGPMFDMGPYYLTTLVNLLGPVKRVVGSATKGFDVRPITNPEKPKFGTRIPVNTPTHLVGIMEFKSGAVGNLIMSFDVWASQLPRIEIYGSEGTLSVPDPNTFGGPIRIRRMDYAEWREVPLAFSYFEQSRGIGLADMAQGIRSGRPHRASGELAYHVLDLMHAFHDASDAGKYVEIGSTCERPAPLPLGLVEGTGRLDE
ncbi:MAG: Gfo/Idh/MocA family oxidoreductase [Planctomycetota bacterium]